jgi:uncharacterized membrane protein YGL010W
MTQAATALSQCLAQYAAYHRDRRNVATHLLGIPMIVLAVEVLLSRPVWLGGVTPAMLASVAAGLFYLRLDLRFGVVMGVLLALCAWAGLAVAALPTAQWLGWGLGLFVVGWAIQFVGHWFEGRKPAFVDDVKSLLIGPLFVVAELAFMLGLRRDLAAQVTGPAPQ